MRKSLSTPFFQNLFFFSKIPEFSCPDIYKHSLLFLLYVKTLCFFIKNFEKIPHFF